MYDSMMNVMSSPWFYVAIGFFVLVAGVPIVAVRTLARREERRDDGPLPAERADGADAVGHRDTRRQVRAARRRPISGPPE